MSETWTINVGARVYGPYTGEQMRTFRAEGRLANHSLVARAGEEQFHPASEDPELAALFSAPASMDEPAPRAEPPQTLTRFGREMDNGHAERSRFVIIAELKTSSITALDDEIHKLGTAFRFMPQSWVLTSEASLNTVRHALMQKLGKMDAIFVVDTMRDRAAWFNFGPEADARVRSLWSRTPEDINKAG